MDFDSIKVLVEDYFNGQYEVKKFLGEGSFSNVCLVKHNFLDDLRAMKIIKEPLKPTTDTVTVFNEVKIATRLRNDNIINIYDAGIISATDDMAYFVMEYVPGGDLEDYLNSFIKSNIQMPLSRVLKIMKQILMGLDALHSSNPPIVHRDLKLNNILLNYNVHGDIEIKISDFGVAKELTTNLSDIDIAGTRPYMAPESFKKNISTMTDIYAVGVIFYQLLSNHYPYDIEKFELDELMDLKPWEDKLTPPSFYNDKIPPKLDEMVVKCLNSDPENRYQNAFELLGELELIIDEMESDQLNYDDIEERVSDDYSNYIINDSILEAFKLAKIENRLSDAIIILEKEILRDYEIRQYYGETLRLWKSQAPDVRLISKAFTVNLNAKNYKLSCDLLREAIAYNPSLKTKYQPYIYLWEIFIELAGDNNLIKAVHSLDELMEKHVEIHSIYKNIITILKTYSLDEILTESICLVNMNNLIDGANLMEFAVVCDSKIRREYQYKLSLFKQNMGLYYKNHDVKGDAVNYAIDLGTVDSVVSYYNDGEPIIIKNYLTGKDFTPSAVLVNNEGVHVGETARNAIFENNKNAVTGFKQDMGFSIPFKSESSILYPEQLSSEVLKDLRVSVYNQCNVNMSQAVICVPPNSNPINTKAIMDAAELAGFHSYNLLFEPIAVSIAYDLINSKDDLWMIYDLGGGTFNISVIKKNNDIVEKYLTDGLSNIGGNSIDWKIVDDIFIPKIINDMHLTDLRRDNPKYAKIFSKLKQAAEDAKIDLSKNMESDICINNLFGSYDFTCRLNRDEFNQIIKPIMEITFNSCYDLLNNNDLNISEMDKIILVGGSCKSPIIQELLGNELKRPLEYSIDPLTVVAKGAAIYAGNIEKQPVENNIESVSLMIMPGKNCLMGRIFTIDKKDSFLGFTAQAIDLKTGKVISDTQISIDGTFKMDCENGDYKFKVYDGEKPVNIDDKSVSVIKNDEVYIRYFNKSFKISTDSLDLNNLTLSMKYLKAHGACDNYDFIERLIELSEIDEKTNVLLNIFSEEISIHKTNIEFSKLLENVKDKLKFTDDEINLDKIIRNHDLDELKRIHEQLIRQYVKNNRNKTIIECFYNLKYEGIYNDDLAFDLMEKGQLKLNDSNFDGLIEIISKLYELDERVF